MGVGEILEKTDYTMISGNPFIKKSASMYTESLQLLSITLEFRSYSYFSLFKAVIAAFLLMHRARSLTVWPFCFTGWRKISFFFNLSYEIKDKFIEFDEGRNVQRAEFVVRAYMQGGRFSDGWGSCDRREKRFLKPNHDIPSTAETRAKNKACQVGPIYFSRLIL
ncbi:hypothetical protein GIB67_011812 [Kingdonia uniflora]|uniref:Uncharacterized protein n=1 Tax=Kingdonia uniflora TaxID=39325 RepID=A0A7J7NXJ0_9MAGN|nr:hypothetical protein GIB67_011812 [Kingdonia uniflora]